MVLAQVAVSSDDLDADSAFYGGLLGLPVIDFRPGSQVLLVPTGQSRLFITPRSQDERFAARPVLYLRVDDLDGEWARLVAAGATVVHEPQVVHRDDNGQVRIGFIQDPAGAPLGLMAEEPA